MRPITITIRIKIRTRGRFRFGSYRYRDRYLQFIAVGTLAAASVLPAKAQEPEELHLPEGFRIGLFADELPGVRGLAFGPDGALYATQPSEGRVLRLPDSDGDGRADTVEEMASGLSRPSGIIWSGSDLLVAEEGRVWRFPNAGGVKAGVGGIDSMEILVDSLPMGGHWTRTLALDPGGRYLFVAVGSSCNVCVEEDPRRGTILRYRIDGGEGTVWARGIRNAVGLAFHPVTGELWATENGRDGLGAELPPEELNAVRRGGDYGWPHCYGQRVSDAAFLSASRCAGTEPPILTFPAHTSPAGLTFYTDTVFPASYRGDAFVALHGSWDRSVPVGYKVMRVRASAGRPAFADDFISGWLNRSGEVWGRPVHLLVGPEGVLYVSDDHGGRIWRVVAVARPRGDR